MFVWTFFALDHAAPDDLASASTFELLLLDVVASPAANAITVLPLDAGSPDSPRGVSGLPAEARGVFDVG